MLVFRIIAYKITYYRYYACNVCKIISVLKNKTELIHFNTVTQIPPAISNIKIFANTTDRMLNSILIIRISQQQLCLLPTVNFTGT